MQAARPGATSITLSITLVLLGVPRALGDACGALVGKL